MPQVLLGRVTCPNCQHQFQTPVEQVLDVGQDPDAKMRVLNGLINVAICPQCGTRGALGLPFLYHDADKELALVYMPMELGRDEVERQQAIGKLTSSVMEDLPPEERKAYLLQPQIFFTMENLVNRILEADGVTPEMIEAQKAKAELLQRMTEVTSDEVLEAMIKENDDRIDADLFQMLAMNLEVAQATGQAASVQRLLGLREKLLELSTEGQTVRARNDMLEALRAEPSRENLLELLIRAPDERTRGLLITFGRPLLDYPFFQALTSRIEAASDESERQQLTELRAEILDIRDRIDEETRALYAERSALLRDLLLSDDPETLARRRFQELDQAFFNVLSARLEDAETAGDADTVDSLRAIWGLVLKLMEETLPPEIQLFNRLMAAEEDQGIDQLLQENRDLVTDRLMQFMEESESNLREQGNSDTADHLSMVLEKAREVAGGGASDLTE